jgi:hypothetical protein
VPDFTGKWELAALWRKKGAKCDKLSMLAARVMGKQANQEYTALYELCEHMQIIPDFTSRYLEWAAYNVRPPHSMPCIRLMVFGWQPTIDHMDFAGILNANALYSFTIGCPQLGFALWYLFMYDFGPNKPSGYEVVVFSTLMSGTYHPTPNP